MKEEITLLTREQAENLDVLKTKGKIAGLTDFYQVQNGFICCGTGTYWTKTPCAKKLVKVYYVDDSDSECWALFLPVHGVRPVISLSKIYENEEELRKVLESDIDIVEYGEYPQSVVDENLEKKLEELYQKVKLKRTKKSYTSMLNEEKEKYQEYIYQNNKYIRVKEASMYWEECEFINRRKAIRGKTYWLKVEPIKWLIDKNASIALSKNLLTCMPFSYKNDDDYEKSDIKVFLEDYFIKEIEPSKSIDTEKIDNLIDLMFETYVPEEKKAKQKVR